MIFAEVLPDNGECLVDLLGLIVLQWGSFGTWHGATRTLALGEIAGESRRRDGGINSCFLQGNHGWVLVSAGDQKECHEFSLSIQNFRKRQKEYHDFGTLFDKHCDWFPLTTKLPISSLKWYVNGFPTKLSN